MLFDQMVVRRSLSPATRVNGTFNGVAIDRAANGGMQDAVAVISTGVITDGSHAVSIEDSDDGTTGWAAVAAAQLQGTSPTILAADDDKMFEVGVRNSRQFLRATVVTTGATVGGLFGAAIALNSPRFSPVSHA